MIGVRYPGRNKRARRGIAMNIHDYMSTAHISFTFY
jgi:hypothetical protein